MRFKSRPRPRPRHTPGHMNKTEQAYAAKLNLCQAAGEIAGYKFEPIKLRLADLCYYTPDFMVLSDHVEFHEVKAWNNKRNTFLFEDDARVKIKVAAEAFPEFVFIVVGRDRSGTWRTERITKDN